jgi:hypothetical protein
MLHSTKPFLKLSLKLSAVIAVILAFFFCLAVNFTAAIALLLNAGMAFIALSLLAKDAERLLLESSPRKFYLVRFSLRLAFFAVWLFLMLALLKMHFIPVLIGLAIPTFSFMGVLFFYRKSF